MPIRVTIIAFLALLLYASPSLPQDQPQQAGKIYLLTEKNVFTGLFYVVDENWIKVSRGHWMSVDLQPGKHRLNFGLKKGKREKKHVEDLEFEIASGQSRYFTTDLNASPVFLGPLDFNLHELPEGEGKYHLQALKPQRQGQ